MHCSKHDENRTRNAEGHSHGMEAVREYGRIPPDGPEGWPPWVSGKRNPLCKAQPGERGRTTVHCWPELNTSSNNLKSSICSMNIARVRLACSKCCAAMPLLGLALADCSSGL